MTAADLARRAVEEWWAVERELHTIKDENGVYKHPKVVLAEIVSKAIAAHADADFLAAKAYALQLEAEVASLKKLTDGLAGRVAGQADLLASRAMKPTSSASSSANTTNPQPPPSPSATP